MNIDVMKILGIVGTVLVLGLVLKDASQFSMVMGSLDKSVQTLSSVG